MLEGEDLEGDRAEGSHDGTAITVHIQAEAAQTLDAEGKIAFAGRFELRDLIFVHDRVNDFLRLVGRQARIARQRFQTAVKADHRRRTHDDMHIAGPRLDRLG